MPTQLDMKTAMAAHLASTTLRLEGDPKQAIQEVAEFLSALPCQIEKRSELSIKARMEHPDGIATVVKVKCFKFTEHTLGDVMEFRRYAGDCTLFSLIWQTYKEFLENKTAPSFFVGQIIPRAPLLQPSPFPDDVPTFYLAQGEKRKLSEL